MTAPEPNELDETTTRRVDALVQDVATTWIGSLRAAARLMLDLTRDNLTAVETGDRDHQVQAP